MTAVPLVGTAGRVVGILEAFHRPSLSLGKNCFNASDMAMLRLASCRISFAIDSQAEKQQQQRKMDAFFELLNLSKSERDLNYLLSRMVELMLKVCGFPHNRLTCIHSIRFSVPIFPISRVYVLFLICMPCFCYRCSGHKWYKCFWWTSLMTA